jgi:ribosome-associated protein
MAKLITTQTSTAPPPSSHTSIGDIAPAAGPLVEAILSVLDDAKAEDIIALSLAGKTSLADAMIIASGRSDRHVGAIADRIAFAIKDMKLPTPRIEGTPVCDWVLIDAGDIIIHLFRPEVRGFYNLEKLWGLGRPQEGGVEDKPAAEKARPRTLRTRPVDAE